MILNKLGWNKKYEKEFNKINKEGYLPSRIVREEKGSYYVRYEKGECIAQVSGKLRYNAKKISNFPSVGDWVAIKLINNGEKAIIYELMTRKSSFTRKSPVSGGRKNRDVYGRKITFGGATEEQVIAANIDIIFLVMSLDDNFNLRRLERYLLIAWNSGAKPIIFLNKTDMCNDLEDKLRKVEDIAKGVKIHCISALNEEGIDELKKYISEGKTIGLFGSSGVGKSTIINCLVGYNKLLTGVVREGDNKGRHTTIWRELVMIPTGGILIDTPGMRELQVWSEKEDLNELFKDIKELESQCKFNDCSHSKEPGCAIKKALEDGTLDRKRYDNYLIMQLEVSYLSDRKSQRDKALTKKEILRSKINGKSKKY